MSSQAEQFVTVSHHAFDPRADEHRRTVHMSTTQVSIERVLDGIRMTVAVPVAAYGAVAIRVQAPSGAATVTLRHAGDRELDVVLARGDAEDATIAAKAWAAVLEKPIEVEAGIVLRPAQPRKARPCPKRPRALGDAGRMTTRFLGEDEIVARS